MIIDLIKDFNRELRVRYMTIIVGKEVFKGIKSELEDIDLKYHLEDGEGTLIVKLGNSRTIILREDNKENK